jgi:dTDP-4-amino-4,6-dideoxygalactose transaminase
MFEDRKGNIVSYDIFERGINLPSYHDLEKSDASKIVNLLIKFINTNA